MKNLPFLAILSVIILANATAQQLQPTKTFTTKSGVCGTLQKPVDTPEYNFVNVPTPKTLSPSKYKYKKYPTQKKRIEDFVLQNYEIVITWGVFYDPDGCEAPYCDTVGVDTIPTNITQEIESSRIGNVWVIRTGIWVTSDVSMPAGFVISQLPTNHLKAGYWVSSYGEFVTKIEAENSLEMFRVRYPEFKKESYVFFLPDCPAQYKYIEAVEEKK